MSERILSAEYTLEDGTLVKITVRRASALVGMRRFQLMVEGDDANKADKESDQFDKAVATLRIVSYPDMVSCTTAVEGIPWPITFEQFSELDEELINKWAEITYKANPHWTSKLAEDGETTEKKVTP